MNDDQLLRYSRQIMLPEVDIDGQEKLLSATVLVVGLGGLGSPIALYLAAAGVGRLILNDDDVVEASNLQRQVVHRTDHIGVKKTESAAQALRELNPEVQLELINQRLTGEGLDNAIRSADLVLDGTDNFTTRFALNDACWRLGVPLVSGAAIRWEGQVSVFDPNRADSPCYRCLYEDGSDEELNCSTNGVIAPLVGIIGTCQAMEAVKHLTGVGDTLVGWVLYFDGKRMEWRKLRLKPREGCRTCEGARRAN